MRCFSKSTPSEIKKTLRKLKPQNIPDVRKTIELSQYFLRSQFVASASVNLTAHHQQMGHVTPAPSNALLRHSRLYDKGWTELASGHIAPDRDIRVDIYFFSGCLEGKGNRKSANKIYKLLAICLCLWPLARPSNRPTDIFFGRLTIASLLRHSHGQTSAGLARDGPS